MSRSQSKIVVVGSINMDLVTRSPRIPVPGETIIGSDFFVNPGGKGANQAISARRLGAKVDMIGCVGQDEFGQQMLDQLKKELIGIDHMKITPNAPTGTAAITVSDEGENIIVVSPGANHQLQPAHIVEAESIFQQADVLLVQLEIPLETVQAAVHMARKYQVRVILNPAPAQKLPQVLLKNIDYLTPNETEAKFLVQNHVKGIVDIESILHQFQSLDHLHVVLTHGADGVYSFYQNKIKHQQAFNIQVKDTTAAGDAFNGGLSVFIAEGHSLAESIIFAQKVAALTCTKLGATSSLPYRQEVEQFTVSNKNQAKNDLKMNNRSH